jgi:virginiamycin B lyase
MLTDDELTRLLRGLEADVPTNPAPIERVFDAVDRERRTRWTPRRGFLAWAFPAGLGLRWPARWSLRPVALLMLFSLLTAILLGGLFVAGQISPPTMPQATAVIRVTPAVEMALGGRPYSIALQDGALWVANGHAVARIDPATAKILTSIATGPGDASVGAGAAGVWVGSSDGNTVSEVDPSTNKVVRSVTVDRPAFIAVGAKDVWVASTATGRVTRIDAASGRIVASIFVGGSPSQPTLALGSVWVPYDCMGVEGGGTEALSRIDPATNQIIGGVAYSEYFCAHAVAISRGNVWFTRCCEGTISEFDPTSGTVLRVVGVGEGANGIVELDGSLWVTFNPELSPSGLARVDPGGGHVAQILDLAFGPESSMSGHSSHSTNGLTQLFALDGSLWVLADFSGNPELLRIDPPK